MNTRFACRRLTALLGVLALQSTAYATFHLMQIEQVIGSVDSDTTAQAIQLRMRAAGQNFVSGGKLIVFDAAGLNPITVLDVASDVTNGAVGDHVLIASASFSSHTSPPAVPDFVMANLIPVSYFAAGSLCWEGDDGIVFWRLSWGGASYTGSNLGDTANDLDGNFGPPFDGAIATTCASALQFQGSATDFSTNNADDYLFKGDEIFFFNNATAGLTVIAPLPTVTITAPDRSASEVPATDTGKFRITRAGCTDSDLLVYFTISGTATNRVDYRGLTGVATIPFGTPSVVIPVRPIDDTIPESDETVILTLSPNPNFYIIGSPSTATVRIRSNE
jgi:hypothetical protein